MNNWIKGVDYPEWMQEEGLKTLQRQHLLDGETPKEMYNRIVTTLSKRLSTMTELLPIDEIQQKWFSYLWKGWLSPSTPILANVGTDRGLGISCFIERVPDSLSGIYSKLHEMAMLTKAGGGVGVSFDKIRGRGEVISTGGFSEGTIPFIKVYDSGIIAANQGSTRRGAASINLPIRHKDIDEFLRIRIPEGDVNRQCLNLNHCVTIDDFFMDDVNKGNKHARELYAKLLSVRMKTGQPYIFYYHNVNKFKPEDFKKRNLKIDGTNICCLAGDTEVITKEGIFKIKDLVGKEVTIFDGVNWVKCNNFQEYDEDNLIRIYLKNGTYIDSNFNHRWFVATNYNDIRDNKYREFKTSELVEGLWLESKFQEYHGYDTMKAAYIKGFLLGDGTTADNLPLLNVHFPKYNCINSLIESAKELEVTNKNTNCITEISISDEIINLNSWGEQRFKKLKGLTSRRDELIKFCREYKHNLPDFRDLKKEDKLLFLSGLLDADGTYSTSGIQLSSISLEFILQIQKLIFSLGYTCGVDFSKREDKISTIYRLTIGNYDSYELFEQLNCNRLEAPEIKPNRRTTGYRQIVKIEKLLNKEKVYCPQVPTTKKFLLANGIMTGNTEIMLPHDFEHTVVCDLASLNLTKYDEWKNDKDFITMSLLFLDVNLEEFIELAKEKPGFDCAVRFARKSRALGLGVLGWHTLLQSKNIPFVSLQTRALITQIGNKLKSDGDEYNKNFGKILGNPEWCDFNRNTTLFAIAPTTTTSLIMGGVSQGIEPIVANSFVQKSAKGTFIRKNKHFEELIKSKYPEYNNESFWSKLAVDLKGSVQELNFLTEQEKQIFLTAYEINQLELIKQAAMWQKYIDQGISLNLFFPADVSPKWFSKCHITAWEEGIKSLYYVRTESILSRNMSQNTFSDCVFCEG